METVVEQTKQEQRTQVLNDVRSLLSWLDAHPEIPLPSEFESEINIYAWDTMEHARAMARAMGNFEKKW
jgi:hypothetical protein